eukprot:11222298-Prorocentrum_lima.AAC.1
MPRDPSHVLFTLLLHRLPLSLLKCSPRSSNRNAHTHAHIAQTRASPHFARLPGPPRGPSS